MSGDWIKMRTDLYRDPKVCVMADILMAHDSQLARYINQNMQRDMAVTRNVMRNVTVGALVSVWGVLRHRGKRYEDDLVVKGCALSVVDDLADIPGFGDAMASVGWIVESEEGLVFPRFFEEFNVDPADEAKQKNAERQRRYREKQRQESNVTQDVTVASQSNAREEKRREEKKSKAQAPFEIPDWVPAEPWGAYLEMRQKIRKAPTDRAKKLVIAELERLREQGQDLSAVLYQSVRKNYTDVYPVKGQSTDDWRANIK